MYNLTRSLELRLTSYEVYVSQSPTQHSLNGQSGASSSSVDYWRFATWTRKTYFWIWTTATPSKASGFCRMVNSGSAVLTRRLRPGLESLATMSKQSTVWEKTYLTNGLWIRQKGRSPFLQIHRSMVCSKTIIEPVVCVILYIGDLDPLSWAYQPVGHSWIWGPGQMSLRVMKISWRMVVI